MNVDELYPGPDGTFFGTAVAALRAGYEVRTNTFDQYRVINEECDLPAGKFVQCRPCPLPDPSGVCEGVGGRRMIMTVVSEMVGRSDLKQWEYANTEGYWSCVSEVSPGWWESIADRDPKFPLTVRRRI